MWDGNVRKRHIFYTPGFIKTLLSLGFWVPLSNISFACYLTHPVFIIFYIGLQETPIHYTDINFVNISDTARLIQVHWGLMPRCSGFYH